MQIRVRVQLFDEQNDIIEHHVLYNVTNILFENDSVKIFYNYGNAVRDYNLKTQITVINIIQG